MSILTLARPGHRDDQSFLLQRARPAMTGLIGGSLSTLAVYPRRPPGCPCGRRVHKRDPAGQRPIPQRQPTLLCYSVSLIGPISYPSRARDFVGRPGRINVLGSLQGGRWACPLPSGAWLTPPWPGS